jgi:hypothetical protein
MGRKILFATLAAGGPLAFGGGAAKMWTVSVPGTEGRCP